MRIDGTTKLYGIIGWPVSHSLSPLFQSYFIEQSGSNAVYLPFAVAPESLQQAVDGLWAVGVQGFNVTVPHKESVFKMVRADSDAKAIGAVNTVRRHSFGWQGSNTDWQGFVAVLKGLELDLKGSNVLLFGAGGTARAVLHALSQLSLGKVYLCNRNPERLAAFQLFAQLTYPQLECETIAWRQPEVEAASRDALLLVNTTSIGLEPTQQFPFQLPASSAGGVAFDAVYRPDGKTAFLAAAEGRRGVDGLPMLIAQGAAAFAFWHSCDWPDCGRALAWTEGQLGRKVKALSGWMANA